MFLLRLPTRTTPLLHPLRATSLNEFVFVFLSQLFKPVVSDALSQHYYYNTKILLFG